MVERTITASIAADPDCGVAMWAPRRLRDMSGFQRTVQRLDDQMEPVDKDAAVALDRLASDIARDAAKERARGINRLILSEENFMGGMRNNFRTGRFYGDTARRLRAFDSVLPASPTVVALGVRDYGMVWTSAYQYLPQVGQAAPPLDSIRDVLLGHKRGWPEVIEAVQTVWPDTEIMVWSQEELGENIAQICAVVAGMTTAQIVVPDGRINERKVKTLGPPVFTDEEHALLSGRYRRHIKRIKRIPAVRWAVA